MPRAQPGSRLDYTMLQALYRRWWWFAVTLVLSPPLQAAQSVHLLGFVEKERDANTVTFRLTPDYAEAVAALMDDKTVILPPVS